MNSTHQKYQLKLEYEQQATRRASNFSKKLLWKIKLNNLAMTTNKNEYFWSNKNEKSNHSLELMFNYMVISPSK